MASAARIGSIWVRGVSTMPAEEVLWKRLARRHSNERRRPTRGKLYLTTRRLIFCPNLLATLLGDEPWSADLGRVRHAGIQPRGPEEFAGASVDLLRIEMRDAGPELLSLRNVDASVTTIERSLPAPSRRTAPAVRVRSRVTG